ncbi:serine/threonine protein kinase [Platysternon megacephalum]|uniref:Serine/threonine protein kinase n=1 Tax=Platysternon megacephalum TaxID=55544 RepID=A0A4D9DKM8_9SAUR|nr:serine/threonine protein kinase [Platysternon megacephalum]
MEEADIRWADIKKATCNFNKDIIQTISKKKGSVIASEKVLRYLEEKNHYRRKLQNATATSARLMKDISQRKEALEKMERETILVEEVVGTSETTHTGIVGLLVFLIQKFHVMRPFLLRFSNTGLLHRLVSDAGIELHPNFDPSSTGVRLE